MAPHVLRHRIIVDGTDPDTVVGDALLLVQPPLPT